MGRMLTLIENSFHVLNSNVSCSAQFAFGVRSEFFRIAAVHRKTGRLERAERTVASHRSHKR